jgi:hypothetical protein
MICGVEDYYDNHQVGLSIKSTYKSLAVVLFTLGSLTLIVNMSIEEGYADALDYNLGYDFFSPISIVTTEPVPFPDSVSSLHLPDGTWLYNNPMLWGPGTTEFVPKDLQFIGEDDTQTYFMDGDSASTVIIPKDVVRSMFFASEAVVQMDFYNIPNYWATPVPTTSTFMLAPTPTITATSTLSSTNPDFVTP